MPNTQLSQAPTMVEKEDEEEKKNDDASEDVEKSAVKAPAAAVPLHMQGFPDGGREAWTVVAGAWLVSFCTWGYINGASLVSIHILV